MKMKKSDIALILGAVLIILIGLLAFNSNEEKIVKPVNLEGEAGIKEISYSDYEKQIESDKPFIVMIVNDGCSYCEKFIPVMKEVSEEYKIPVSSINLANLTQEEYSALAKSNVYLKTEQWGTPTTLILKGKRVIDSLGGYTDKEALISFMEENVKINTEEEK